jgi:hypothetical protein
VNCSDQIGAVHLLQTATASSQQAEQSTVEVSYPALQSQHHRILWAGLQVEFERHVRRNSDLRAALAAVVTDDSEFIELRNTLLRMEALRHPEFSTEQTENDPRDKKVDNVPKSAKLQPWTFGRLALSQRACRLELPVDIKHLQDLSPQDYIRHYCRISARRLTLYKKIFNKYQEKAILPFKDLYKAFVDIFSGAIEESDVLRVCRLLDIGEETRIDLQLFGAMAAITERILYPQFVTEHTKDIEDYKQLKIEAADFCSLRCKLEGVNVNGPMKALLQTLYVSMQTVSGSAGADKSVRDLVD